MTTAPPSGPVRRILVYGVTGAGKTTLAEQIAARTGLPWHSVDELTWEPGWVSVPDVEQRSRIDVICSGEAWILDTAYHTWMDVPLARVELIVALDYRRMTSLGRLVRRCVRRVVTRELACNGNVETVRKVFSTDSIIRWHFRSFSNKRRQIRAWASSPPPPTVARFGSPRATKRWLRGLDLSDSVARTVNGRGEIRAPSAPPPPEDPPR